MARPRLPQAKAETLGATVKDPGRFADRKGPKRVRPLGDPYATMSEAEKAVWTEFRAELPWLNSSQRVLLRMACILTARLDNEVVGINTMQTLSAILSKLGATPVDETKVNHGDGEETEPEDKFFGRPN